MREKVTEHGRNPITLNRPEIFSGNGRQYLEEIERMFENGRRLAAEMARVYALEPYDKSSLGEVAKEPK